MNGRACCLLMVCCDAAEQAAAMAAVLREISPGLPQAAARRLAGRLLAEWDPAPRGSLAALRPCPAAAEVARCLAHDGNAAALARGVLERMDLAPAGSLRALVAEVSALARAHERGARR